jgi:hypothetical protein
MRSEGSITKGVGWWVVRWRPTAVCAHDAGSTPQVQSSIGQGSRPDVASNFCFCWKWVQHLALSIVDVGSWELGIGRRGGGFVRGGKHKGTNFALWTPELQAQSGSR